MKHAQDDIVVYGIRLPYIIGRGWLMPSGQVVTNPLKAQRLAEDMANRMEAV